MQAYIILNDGTKIPQFGLGVYQIPEGEATYNAVLDALKIGVRHIDTAHAYQNERSVGKAVRNSGVPREEVWITTKLWPHEYGAGKTAAAIDKMLDRLGTDYIDLLLLHQQFGDYLGAWKDMEKAVKADKVKSIGISNFESERLEEITCAGSESYHYIRSGMIKKVNTAGWCSSKKYGALPEYQQTLLMNFVNNSVLGIYRQWIEEGKQQSFEEIIELTNKLVLGGVKGFFK